MTQSVADKTPIPEKAWRRHSDPPALWFGVATISIILHLLLFWLLRSYASSLLSQRSSSNPVPIEFVEVVPRRRASLKAKPVSPKRPSTTSKSSTLKTPKPAIQESLTAKSTSRQEDRNAIAFTNPKKARTQPQPEDTTEPSSSSPIVEQKETQPSPQPFVTSQPTRQPQPIPESTTPFENEQPPISESTTPLENEQPPIPESTTPLENEQPQPTQELNTTDNLDDTQNQANQKLGEQNQAATPSNALPETTPSQPFNEPTETPVIPGQPGGRVSVGEGTPLEEIAPPVKPEQLPPLDEQNEGRLVASWDIEAGKLKRDRDRPENLAQPEGNSSQKELSLVLPDAANNSQPVDFLVWLTIDEKGNLIFIKVDENIPQTQRSQYQEYAEEIFQGQKFVAATDTDPTTGKPNPRMSYLPVRVRIKRP